MLGLEISQSRAQKRDTSPIPIHRGGELSIQKVSWHDASVVCQGTFRETVTGNQSGSCLPTLQHQAEAPPRLEMVLELGLSDWGSGFAGG